MHASSVTTHHKTIGPVLKPSQLGNRWLAACSFESILSSHLLPRIQEVKFNLFFCVGWKCISSKCKGQFCWTPQGAWWHIRLRMGGLTLCPEPSAFRFIIKQRTLSKSKSKNYSNLKHCFSKCARSCSYSTRNFRLADTLKLPQRILSPSFTQNFPSEINSFCLRNVCVGHIMSAHYSHYVLLAIPCSMMTTSCIWWEC